MSEQRYEWVGYSSETGLRFPEKVTYLDRYPSWLWRIFFTADEVQEHAERERQKARLEAVLERILDS